MLGLVMISEHDIKSTCHKEKNRHNGKINVTCIGTYIYMHTSIYTYTRIHIHVYVCTILLAAWGILVPQPEIEPGSSAVKSRSSQTLYHQGIPNLTYILPHIYKQPYQHKNLALYFKCLLTFKLVEIKFACLWSKKPKTKHNL